MTNTYKILAQSNPVAATLTDAYTVPGSTQTIVSSIVVANRSATPTAFRISIAPGGAPDSPEQYVAYDAEIVANESWAFVIGATLQPTDKIRVRATLATLSFNVFGEEIS